MTFLTFDKFVNEELDKFFEESDKHGNFKAPIDINLNMIEHQKNSFMVEPKMKKTKVKHKKTWTKPSKGTNLF